MTLKKATLGLARTIRWNLRYGRTKRRIAAGLALKPGPSWVQIGIDEHCNYRCVMCRTHSYLLEERPKVARLPKETYDRAVRELASLGTKAIDICGFGEPMLHPHAMEMFRLVRELGMECRLVTNGSRLSPEVCAEFIEMGLDRLRVSINAGTDDTHHELTRAPQGEWTQIMENAGLLVRLRDEAGIETPVVGMTIAIHKMNFAEVETLAREASVRGIDELEFLALGINEASAELALTEEEQAEVRRQVEAADAIMQAAGKKSTARDFLSRPGEELWTKDIFSRIPCHVGQFFCRINATGDVNPCCPSIRVIGNLHQDSFRTIWSSESYRAFRKEAMALPERGGDPVRECFCHNCYHFPYLIQYHENLTSGHLDGLL
ncbi:MAG: radical SAM protein [Armatimonadetes bacterium]|nr:radical SAM protein [Armatimonadota bacterium]